MDKTAAGENYFKKNSRCLFNINHRLMWMYKPFLKLFVQFFIKKLDKQHLVYLLSYPSLNFKNFSASFGFFCIHFFISLVLYSSCFTCSVS